MRYRFDVKVDPPVLHRSVSGYLGVREVSNNQLTPAEIVHKSYILSDSKYHNRIRNAVQAQCRKIGTTNSKLRRELDMIIEFGYEPDEEDDNAEESMEAAEREFAEEDLSSDDIKDCVTYVIQNTPGQWILGVLGWFFYDIKLYTQVTHSMPCYLSEADKQNGKLSWVDVPFFKVPSAVFTILMLWCRIPIDDFKLHVGPFVDELHLLSYMDSCI